MRHEWGHFFERKSKEHFHEGTKLGVGNALAGVSPAHIDFLGHAVDHLLRTVEAFLLGSVDVHGAVVLDIDHGTENQL